VRNITLFFSIVSQLDSISSADNALTANISHISTNGLDSSVSATTLSTFEIFKSLRLQDREWIASRARQHTLKKGQYIISAAGENRDVFFIVQGNVCVCSFSENGKQVQFDRLTAGMMFGELAALDGASRSSDCIADSDVNLVALNDSDFREVLFKHKEVQRAVMQRLVRLVRSNMQRVFEFSAFNVPQRVRCELLRLASHCNTMERDIILNNVPTHAEIATRISTHREAVTRELKMLEGAGVITWRPQKHVIHDISHLMNGIEDI